MEGKEDIGDTASDQEGSQRHREALLSELGASQGWRRELAAILRSKPALYALGSLAFLVVLRLGVNWLARGGKKAQIPTVLAIHPALREMDKVLSLPANIEAIEEAKLYAHASGYIQDVYHDEGDYVKAGTLLADINDPDAVQAYNQAKANYKLQKETRARYAELLKGNVISEQEYDTIAAAAAEAKAQLNAAKANVEYARIRAPFTGSIARRYMYVGDLVTSSSQPGKATPIFLMVNESRLRIAVYVPQSAIDGIHIGDPVSIRVDDLPGRVFHGAVSRIDAQLNVGTKTERVLIDIKNKSGKLHAGMFVTVGLLIRRDKNALTVPLDAVLGPQSNPYVDTVVNGRIVPKPVKIGFSNLNFVEISKGLSLGDIVAIPGAIEVSKGERVNPMERPVSGLAVPGKTEK